MIINILDYNSLWFIIVIIILGYNLSPVRRQGITYVSGGYFCSGTLGSNFNEIVSQIR